MSSHFPSNICLRYAFALTLVIVCFSFVTAQNGDFSNNSADPIRLFERGQDAHARGDYKLALEFYEEAIKLRPEFPEAELQRGQALASLNRREDAERALRRAIELRPNWVLPYAKLGFLLARVMDRPAEAEPLFRKSLELEPRNFEALFELANLRRNSGDLKEAIALWKRATSADGATASTWDALGATQFEAGDPSAAVNSFTKSLAMNPSNEGARQRRAGAYLALGDNQRALEDIRSLSLPAKPAMQDTHSIVEVAALYLRASRKDEAIKLLDTVNESAQSDPEVIAFRFQIDPNNGNAAAAAASLEKLSEQSPREASLLAQLGSIYRTIDPPRSADYYRRASELEPRNADYATGYAAALVQARRFAEAAAILRRIISLLPDSYVAHANLATALYEQKRFAESLLEYEWLARAKPEIAATYFFMATAHDSLGAYPQALSAYEKFLATANVQKNKLEIEKVNLRLPVLRNQIKRGEGVKSAKQ
ncbi:MAG: tetratricopeptide repeat protein [Pyrinomonadaceae bacterium]